MLKRASCQPSKTLEQDYRALAELPPENGFSRVGQQMLRLLPLLSDVCAPREVWSLTSHAQLCLLAADDWESPWYVQIDAVPWGGFEVRYLLPPAEAPWPRATVLGYAFDETQACEMIRTAMQRAGGWR